MSRTEQTQTRSNQLDIVGSPGLNPFRSEGRAYYNHDIQTDHHLKNYEELRALYQLVLDAAQEHGRRRAVCRALISQPILDELLARGEIPLEVDIPLDMINSDHDWPNEHEHIVVLGQNFHPSEVPEWQAVAEYWRNPPPTLTPIERIRRTSRQFRFIATPRPEDLERLHQIWQPFGWSPAGVSEFIEGFNRPEWGLTQPNGTRWFSGVVDRQSDQLVSACLGDYLQMGRRRMVEGTEYGTLPGWEGRGLCSSAVIGLYAQILNSLWHHEAQPPVIFAEFNMTARSDIVGHHAGMTIPLVANRQEPLAEPLQVMRHNVTVLDRHQPNDIQWQHLPEPQKSQQRDAWRMPHRYLRNFIVGILPSTTIYQQYGGNIGNILEHYE